MKRRYLRIVRRAYRYLRHPRIQKYPWLISITKPLFDRDLWHPCRYTVAGGLSVGLFCAMLPIPFQMLLAALAGVRARVNIPIAMAACWVSNPFTQAPIWLAQERLGDWIRSNSNHALLHMLDVEKTVFGVTLNMASFVVGFITLGIVLSIIAYPIVYGISAFLPHKGKRLTPSMRRSKSPSSTKKSS
ncbi:MAG TPA: hypothetical protein DHW77_03375 [Verrucomicrobiales bacterium]|nr:hypothetical protein [Verrucomicrobiales bacterium]